MGFRTNCDIDYKDENGKPVRCRKEMEVTIDKVTGEVYCECGNKMKDQNRITEFAKRQMISMGQVRKSEKKNKAFSVKCKDCEKEGPPVLSKEGGKLLCTYCDKELTNLNKPFAQMLKQTLTSQRKANQ